MVKIRALDLEVNNEITFDPYVPLDIKWGHWDEIKESTKYCRFGDFKYSLLEIGVNSVTEQIRSVTLVEIRNIEIFQSKCEIAIGEVEIGTPAFFTDNWVGTDRLDITAEIKLKVYLDGLIINVGETNATRFIRNGKVIFGLNQSNEMCFIRLVDIDNDKIVALKESLS